MIYDKWENEKIINVLKGTIIALVITLITIFTFAVLLIYTDISEKIIPISIITLTFISILIGTIIGTRNISKNGMLCGGIVGGVYVAFLYLISSIINTGFAVNMYSILMVVSGFLAGIIGGIIGVNIKK